MSKLYSTFNKLNIPRLVEAWGLEIGEDPDRLAETLVWAALDGRFDAVAHEDGETKPGIVVRPNMRRDSVNRWDSETLREWIRIVADASEIGFSDALSSVLPRIAVTREACVDFAEATGLKPPSFWRRKPSSRPTKTARKRTKEVFQELVGECRARGQRMSRDEAFQALKTRGENISGRQFHSEIWKPLAPDDWRNPGAIPTDMRVDPKT